MTKQHFIILQSVSWVGGSFASWYQLWCWDDYSQTGCRLQGLEWLRCGQLKSHLDSRLGAQPGSFFFFFFLVPSLGLQGLPHSMVAGFWERASRERGSCQASLGVKGEDAYTYRDRIVLGIFGDLTATVCHFYLLCEITVKFLVSFFSWVVLYFGVCVCGGGMVALILRLG